jgi:hypothetical protein
VRIYIGNSHFDGGAPVKALTSCLTESLSAGNPSDRIPSFYLLLKPNAVAMSTNPVHRKYSRHINIRRHTSVNLPLMVSSSLFPSARTIWWLMPWRRACLVRHREVMMGHQRFQPFYARSLNLIVSQCCMLIHSSSAPSCRPEQMALLAPGFGGSFFSRRHPGGFLTKRY